MQSYNAGYKNFHVHCYNSGYQNRKTKVDKTKNTEKKMLGFQSNTKYI